LFTSNALRYRLTTILMRVLGIKERDEAIAVMKTIRTCRSDQKILDELQVLFPEKRVTDQGDIACLVVFLTHF
jgi:hypothetical protein